MQTTKWFMPLFSVALGLVILAAQWVGGDPGGGLVSIDIQATALAGLAVIAAVIVLRIRG